MADSTENNKDLDSYGVWVKRPPQDVSAETTESPDITGIDTNLDAEDFSIPDTVVAEDFSFDSDNDSTLSDEELSNITNDIVPEEKTGESEDLDDMFNDLPDFSTDATETAAVSVETVPEKEAEEKSAEPEIEEFSIDDFMSDSDSSSESVSAGSDGEISLDEFMDGDFTDPNPGAAPVSSGSDDGEISLDDFLDDSSSSEKEDDVSNDDPLDIDLSFTENPDEEVPTEDSETEMQNESFEETTDFDDMFDTPVTESNDASSGLTESSGFNSEGTEEISLEDFGLDENSDDATAVAAGAAVNSASEEVDLSDFGIDSDADETPVKQDVQGSKKKQIVDYDLAITEDDSVTQAPTAETIPASASADEFLKEAAADAIEPAVPQNATVVDNSILDQIMIELNGLKNEINSLKDEFNDLKNKEPETSAAEMPVSEEIDIPETENETVPEEPDVKESSGFFDNNDEDDTIALSGDELTNIMNTADFTETTGESAAEEIMNDDNFGIEEEASDIEIPDTLPEDIASEISIPVAEDSADTVVEEPAADSFDEAPVSSVAENLTTDDTFGIIDEAAEEEMAEVDSGLSMNTEESLIEPDFNDLEASANDEIAIPTVDEICNSLSEETTPEESILVESSDADLMNSVNDSTDSFEAPVMDDIAEEPAVEEPIMDDIAEEPAVLSENEDTALPNVDEIAETVSTDDTFAEENAAVTEDAVDSDDSYNDMHTEEETVSEGISDENVDYLTEEPVIETTVEPEMETVASPAVEAEPEETPAAEADDSALPEDLKKDVKSVLLYMDQLLENLPEDKIMEFAKSEQFSTYKKLFSELGLS